MERALMESSVYDLTPGYLNPPRFAAGCDASPFWVAVSYRLPELEEQGNELGTVSHARLLRCSQEVVGRVGLHASLHRLHVHAVVVAPVLLERRLGGGSGRYLALSKGLEFLRGPLAELLVDRGGDRLRGVEVVHLFTEFFLEVVVVGQFRIPVELVLLRGGRDAGLLMILGDLFWGGLVRRDRNTAP
jgi:hypothetical protein